MRTFRSAVIGLHLMAMGVSTSVYATDKMPTFDVTGCETVSGYDPAWNTYGEEYGLQLTPKKDYNFIFGFYQMQEQAGKLYAAFGGALGPTGPVKGARPGAVVVLDAGTLEYERAIALPFHAHAMAMSPKTGELVVTHTSAGTFSVVNVETQEVQCFKPEISNEDITFRSRYVAVDEDGNIYINYNTDADIDKKSIVVKYSGAGEKVDGFALNSIEDGPAAPLYYQEGSLYTGSKGVKRIDATSGMVERIGNEQLGLRLFNYTAGHATHLLATNMNSKGDDGLYMFDLQTGSNSSLFTGSSALEIAYSPETERVFTTNLESKTVSVIALPNTAQTLEGRDFVNIRIDRDADIFFRGIISNLYVKQSPQRTELYITQKYWDDENAQKHGILSKITLAGNHKGINGIAALEGCTVMHFNMKDKSVSEAESCEVLSAEQSYQAEIERLQLSMKKLMQEQDRTQAQLLALNTQSSSEQVGVAALERARLEQYQNALRTAIQQAQQASGRVKGLAQQ